MKAVIMAGGEGTRLRPLTSTMPKPMLPLANRPMMEHVVNLLRRHGFDEIVVTVAFMANAIRTYFGDGSEFGVKMVYANEDTPLGTAGSVRNAADELTERFLVISGDVLCGLDLTEIWKYHEQSGAMATIGLKKVANPLDFGIVITNSDGTIERFLEKPTWGQVFSDTINTGIYVFEPEIFDYIEPDRQIDFSSDVFPKLLEDNKGLYGCVLEGYWEDVGTLESYSTAHHDILDGKVQLEIPGFRVADGVWLGEGAYVDPKAIVEAPVVIGDFCRIEAGARLRSYTVLGSNVRVGPETTIERSVVHDNTYFGTGVSVGGAIIGRTVDIRDGTRIDAGAVLGDQVFVGAHTVIGGGVKIYPEKTIEAGAVVNSSIVWESRGVRTLFGAKGVSGLANVDIGPELAVRLAMAFGTTLRKGAKVVMSRDTSRTARALKRAMMAGLNASGVDVEDLEVATVPVTRFEIQRSHAAAGLTVGLASDDPSSVLIRFFDAQGAELDEGGQRKIERLLAREDFRRVLADEMGDLNFPPRTQEFYSAAMLREVALDVVRQREFKVVLDYAAGTVSEIMPTVLAKLGIDVLAINPFASTRRAIVHERRSAARRVGDLVKSSKADFGAVIDGSGERITLVDDLGRTVSGAHAALVAVTLLATQDEGITVVAPLNMTDRLESTAQALGTPVVRSKLSPNGVQRVAQSLSHTLAVDGVGGFVFPQQLAVFDGASSFVKFAELLARDARPLSAIVNTFPPIDVVHETVPTPWEAKGTVMRSLVDLGAGDQVQLIDGVHRRSQEGWTLVVPDPDEPLTHIWAEAVPGASTTATTLASCVIAEINNLVGDR